MSERRWQPARRLLARLYGVKTDIDQLITAHRGNSPFRGVVDASALSDLQIDDEKSVVESGASGSLITGAAGAGVIETPPGGPHCWFVPPLQVQS